MPLIGNTIRLHASFYNFSEVLTDPTSITLKFFDQRRNQVGTDITIGIGEKISTGVYEYDYTIPNINSNALIYEFKGIIGGFASLSRGIIALRWV
jgi:hypothetical protein